MIEMLISAAMLMPSQQPPPVPGLCSEPAADHVGEPGCYLSAELLIPNPPSQVYWHIAEFATRAQAEAQLPRHPSAIVVEAHGRILLFVIGPQAETVSGGQTLGVVGPMSPPPGPAVTARFMESLFPPGMRTRVHAHSGPEAFFVLAGQQCVETASSRRVIGPGESFIVSGGPHLQAAPTGRASIVLVLAAVNEPWMTVGDHWVASGYCDSPPRSR